MPKKTQTSKQERRVAILGTSRATRALAPFDDPSWEIWGTARRQSSCARWDRWFECHDVNTLDLDEWLPHLMEVTTQGRPLYTHFPVPDCVPNIVRYPKEEICGRFGTYFMTSGISWMLALAIHEGVDRIGIWGVDAGSVGEYARQRAGIVHFLELAHFAGTQVDIPAGSELARNPLPYPYDEYDPVTQNIKFHRERIRAASAEAAKQLKQIEHATAKNEGIQEAFDWMELFWRGLAPDEAMRLDSEDLNG